ncbi:MAG: sulfatase-like hydrolase/transferase, partial [Planctomycetota bacterium]
HGGSAGLLRDGKGSTWEGGMREPAIAWWPGKIKPGITSQDLACTMDLFPTCLKLAGIDLPDDRIIDGKDMAPILFGSGPSLRKSFIFYRGYRLMAARKGPWKAHFMTQDAYGPNSKTPVNHDPPLLYNLEHDPSEKYDIAKEKPEVIADIMAEVKRHKDKMIPGESQIEKLPKK